MTNRWYRCLFRAAHFFISSSLLLICSGQWYRCSFFFSIVPPIILRLYFPSNHSTFLCAQTNTSTVYTNSPYNWPISSSPSSSISRTCEPLTKLVACSIPVNPLPSLKSFHPHQPRTSRSNSTHSKIHSNMSKWNILCNSAHTHLKTIQPANPHFHLYHLPPSFIIAKPLSYQPNPNPS